MTRLPANEARVAVLSGDGVGPEVTHEAVRALRAAATRAGLGLTLEHGLLGGAAIEETGVPLPDDTLALCEASDALLVGAVGGPRWDGLPADRNPGPGGLLRLRRDLDLFANLRPASTLVPEASPLRVPTVDILLVREAVGGLYFSPERGRRRDGSTEIGWDTMSYTAEQVRRIAVVAFELAAAREGRLASVDKANVLESSRLWRDVVDEVASDFPQVTLDHLYVDNCAMQLVLRPQDFDVIVTENLFGDVLSDELAGLVGSLGLLPSGSLRSDRFGLYEPVHGSAPDIAGTGAVNPAAAILSAAMMLRHSLGHDSAAADIERAVASVLRRGTRTPDLAGAGPAVSTSSFGDAVVAEIERHPAAEAS
ncbi:3-isopropylmalate dehydrogenase [Actinomycetospora sp. NBRC 106375]|uniref:3-isopropylmalate dehydrogenase n=1 Tax=Actinomycetospora sp. NBRC 106375 TaxID=3032207 RepID=UPI0024A48D86|nr:3-isopropylmalate dehydrogenase [Actinomycetospora sp. NBRC 106375]GLZ49877.1 3-isopropylmalate dehydrogenase [Actinomycetospora sp. NBRC 106375]